MAKHHDTGDKELFSHPAFVQPLTEGFAPAEIAALGVMGLWVIGVADYALDVDPQRDECAFPMMRFKE
ncbi:MAG: hypothetical protein VBE63_28555 [Lamprobacter sp.]|uniref:hypothetical protein n=1 Tax=Lamprobacter sp. TaxID=3100796 RepID=UPI002B25DBCB|nr:hypothetical protein [Lamprobacter sp.]MEA3643847.1 hypothetical protein [Lamprobacter sp.]